MPLGIICTICTQVCRNITVGYPRTRSGGSRNCCYACTNCYQLAANTVCPQHSIRYSAHSTNAYIIPEDTYIEDVSQFRVFDYRGVLHPVAINGNNNDDAERRIAAARADPDTHIKIEYTFPGVRPAVPTDYDHEESGDRAEAVAAVAMDEDQLREELEDSSLGAHNRILELETQLIASRGQIESLRENLLVSQIALQDQQEAAAGQIALAQSSHQVQSSSHQAPGGVPIPLDNDLAIKIATNRMIGIHRHADNIVRMIHDQMPDLSHTAQPGLDGARVTIDATSVLNKLRAMNLYN